MGNTGSAPSATKFGTARLDSNTRFGQEELVGIPKEDPGYLRDWHSCITAKKFNNESEEIEFLRAEASTKEDYRLAFEKAAHAGKSVQGLTRAQCLAVTMYTVNDPPFNKTFNESCRNGFWRDYEIFSTLLYSACERLRYLDPIENSQVLYRGLMTDPNNMLPGEFFWPQFTSTSLAKEVADQFSMSSKTILIFDACVFGAKIDKLSVFGGEQEVLITPFEAFDYKNEMLNSDGQLQLQFAGCINQSLLNFPPTVHNTESGCQNNASVEQQKIHLDGGNNQFLLQRLASTDNTKLRRMEFEGGIQLGKNQPSVITQPSTLEELEPYFSTLDHGYLDTTWQLRDGRWKREVCWRTGRKTD